MNQQAKNRTTLGRSHSSGASHGEGEIHSPILIRVVESHREFLNLEAGWRNLEDCSEESTVFQTWEWNMNWWEVYGVQAQARRKYDLSVLVAYVDDRMVGIAPVCFERIPGIPVRRLIFLGGTHTDYCNFLAGPPYRSAVIGAFIEYIKQLIGIWDVVELKHLHGTFSTTEFMKGMGLVKEMTPCPYLDLPRTVQELDQRLDNTILTIR